MQIAVLGSSGSWYLQDLRRAAAGRHQIIATSFHELCSQVNVDRVTVKAGSFDLRECGALLVRTMPPGSLEQIVFRMDALAQLAAAGLHVVNPPPAIEAAVDKYLALARLQAAGLTVPRTVACQTTDEAMEAFAMLGGDVVLKPLFGAEGRGITRVTDTEIAWRSFRLLEDCRAVIYLQQFIPHEGFDVRAFVIGNEVLGMKRIHPTDWRTNVSRGASTEAMQMDALDAEQAMRAAAAVGAKLAGVDLLPARDGRLYVLEVNAVPGWRALAQTINSDVAKKVLQFLCKSA